MGDNSPGEMHGDPDTQMATDTPALGEMPKECVGGKQAQGRAPRGTAFQQWAEPVRPRKAGREELARRGKQRGPQKSSGEGPASK